MHDEQDIAQMRLAYYEYLADATSLQAGTFPIMAESGAAVQFAITAEFAEAVVIDAARRVYEMRDGKLIDQAGGNE